MRSRDLCQVVVPPLEADDVTMSELQAIVDAMPASPVSRWSLVKSILSSILHPVGLHHYVEYRTFNPQLRRIIVHPNTWICEHCAKGFIE